EKLLPGGFPEPFWRWFDPMLLQYIGNRATTQVVTEIRDGTQNPAISPITIVLSQADYEVLDIIGGAWPSGSALGTAIILFGNEFAVPGQQCVRRHKVGNVIQYSTADKFGFGCQAATLVIGKPQSPSTELLSEEPGLL